MYPINLNHHHLGELKLFLGGFLLPYITGINKFYSRKCQLQTPHKNKKKAQAAVLTIQCSTGTGFHVMWLA